MSGGPICQCDQRLLPVDDRHWEVTQRRMNHSAFSGYHRTPSKYSTVRCRVCHACWRTTARYVNQLPDAAPL